MPDGDGLTGKIQTVLEKANGKKKTVAAHATSASAGSVATVIFITQAFGPLTGLAKIDAIKATSDTAYTMVMVQEANSKAQGQRLDQVDHKLENLDEKLDKVLVGVSQNLTNQGIKPKFEKETIIDYYQVSDTNITAAKYWKHGPAADTLMLPVKQSLWDAVTNPSGTRPR